MPKIMALNQDYGLLLRVVVLLRVSSSLTDSVQDLFLMPKYLVARLTDLSQALHLMPR